MNDAILSAVSTVGFPIVVSFYLLVRFQKTIDRFQINMDRFSNKVDDLILELRKGCYERT